MNKRERFALWEESCLEIERKAIYRNYPMNFSILSDFTNEDLEQLMTLGITYSREGSYADPEDITIDSKSVNH